MTLQLNALTIEELQDAYMLLHNLNGNYLGQIEELNELNQHYFGQILDLQSKVEELNKRLPQIKKGVH